MTMTRPVIEQMTMVSRKTPSMAIVPCRAGLSVMAVACAIGELPMPASLEKMPRAIPKRIAAQTVAPAKPPAADTGVNALLTIVATADGISEKFRIRMRMPAAK